MSGAANTGSWSLNVFARLTSGTGFAPFPVAVLLQRRRSLYSSRSRLACSSSPSFFQLSCWGPNIFQRTSSSIDLMRFVLCIGPHPI